MAVRFGYRACRNAFWLMLAVAIGMFIVTNEFLTALGHRRDTAGLSAVFAAAVMNLLASFPYHQWRRWPCPNCGQPVHAQPANQGYYSLFEIVRADRVLRSRCFHCDAKIE